MDEFGFEVGDPTAAYGSSADHEAAPPMVEFRGHDGRSLAVPYTRLLSIEYRHERGVSLEFPEHRIAVYGRNLRPLYDALLQHRVTFVQEGDLDVVLESDPFVNRIVIAPREVEVEYDHRVV